MKCVQVFLQRVNCIQHETVILPWLIPCADAFRFLPGELRPTRDAAIPHLQPPALQFEVRADTLHNAEDRTILGRQGAPAGPDALERGDAIQNGGLLEAKLVFCECREQVVGGPP